MLIVPAFPARETADCNFIYDKRASNKSVVNHASIFDLIRRGRRTRDDVTSRQRQGNDENDSHDIWLRRSTDRPTDRSSRPGREVAAARAFASATSSRGGAGGGQSLPSSSILRNGENEGARRVTTRGVVLALQVLSRRRHRRIVALGRRLATEGQLTRRPTIRVARFGGFTSRRAFRTRRNGVRSPSGR